MKLCMLLFFFFFLFTSFLFAQEDSTLKSLNEIVITATRTKQDAQKISYLVNSINRKELDQFSPRTTPEALMGLSGVFVQKTNHGGGSAFVRGLTGNQTLMLIDGIRLNNSTFRFGPNQYLNTIDQFTIQRIEVVKGTGSVQYGSDALGGVLQVFTKEPEFADEMPSSTLKKKVNGIAIIKWMNRGMEQTARGELNYSSKTFAVSVGATLRNFGNIVGGDTTGKQSPSGYKEQAYNAKLKFKLSPFIELIAAHQFVQQQHVPVYHKVRLENFFLNEMNPQQRMLNYAKLRFSSKNKWIQSVEIISSYQQTAEGRNLQSNGSTILRKERDEVNTFGFTVDVFSSIQKNWTANSGVELYHDHVSSIREDVNTATSATASKRGLYPDKSAYGNYSLFTLHQFSFSAFQINAGLRFNTFRINITDTSLGKVKVQPSAIVANFSLLYNLSKKHQLFFSFNNCYRAPNIDDMGTLGIVDFRYEIPAYNLQPEQSYNYEAGYKFRDRTFHFSTSAFYMDLRNLITRIRSGNDQINGYNVYIKQNTDKALIKGAEAEAQVNILHYWKASASIAYLFGQNKTRNEPLRRIPPANGRIRISYSKNKIMAATETWFATKQKRLAQGDRDDNRIPAGGTPGFSVLNFFAGYQIKQLQIQTGLQNILNEDYRTHGSGINGYGRSMWVQLQFTFK